MRFFSVWATKRGESCLFDGIANATLTSEKRNHLSQLVFSGGSFLHKSDSVARSSYEIIRHTIRQSVALVGTSYSRADVLIPATRRLSTISDYRRHIRCTTTPGHRPTFLQVFILKSSRLLRISKLRIPRANRYLRRIPLWAIRACARAVKFGG